MKVPDALQACVPRRHSDIIKPNDRVVVEQIKRIGTVRWIGTLYRFNAVYGVDPYCGVEMDLPCGGGSGLLNGEQLFKCKPGYAFIVPMAGLSKLHGKEAKQQIIDRMSYKTAGDFEENVLMSFNTQSTTKPTPHVDRSLKPIASNPLYTGTTSKQFSERPTLMELNNTTVTCIHSPTKSSDRIENVSFIPCESSHQKSSAISPDSVSIQSFVSESRRMSFASPSTTSNREKVSDACDRFGIDACVEVDLPINNERNKICYGIVRWIGELKHDGDRLVGIELEEDVPIYFRTQMLESTSIPQNTLNDIPIFRRAFVMRSFIRPDSRFTTPVIMPADRFGEKDSPPVTQYTLPPVVRELVSGRYAKVSLNSLKSTSLTTYCTLADVTGQCKGIQGHSNSCYLDATLYALFAHCDAFDHLLLQKVCDASPEYDAFRHQLATTIVYPLRCHQYVRADKVMMLRKKLASLVPHLKDVITSQEMDPEEFLSALLLKILKVPPFIRLIDGANDIREEHLCQILIDDTIDFGASAFDVGTLPTTQMLLERYFTDGRLRFDQTPHVLIIQQPRSGSTRRFQRILPNDTIDVTHFVDKALRPCANAPNCLSAATLFCRECYMTRVKTVDEATFCRSCYDHSHKRVKDRSLIDHSPDIIKQPPLNQEYSTMAPRRRVLTLASVLCISSSHYVAYARTNVSLCATSDVAVGVRHDLTHGDSIFLVMDSMADRVGGDKEHGYCLPEVRACAEVSSALTHEGEEQLRATLAIDEKQVPYNIDRLLKDAYICVYIDQQRAPLQLQPPKTVPFAKLNNTIH